MYETFDHTADLGLRVRAATLEELFVEAARGLTAILVQRPEAIAPREVRRWSLPGDPAAPELLLFDWLAELLYAYATERLVFGEFEVAFVGDRLEATARGELCDPIRHEPTREVKAITYHGLRAERAGDGWLAEAIVDI